MTHTRVVEKSLAILTILATPENCTRVAEVPLLPAPVLGEQTDREKKHPFKNTR